MLSMEVLEEKRDILYALAPFSEELKALKRRMDLIDFAFSGLRLYGSALTREGVEGVLDGISVPGVPVFEHRLCRAHQSLLHRFAGKLEMELDVDDALLREFCALLAGGAPLPHRTGTPLLYHLDFVPCDESCISAELVELFAQLRRRERHGLHSAAVLHAGIVRTYPYEEGYTELVARAAMQYELMRAGYFPVDIGVPEPVYNEVTAAAIKSGDTAAFEALLFEALCKKMQTLITAAGQGV